MRFQQATSFALQFQTFIDTRVYLFIRYFDPQYFLRRQLTPASDVYSFGVVLLELITGRRAIDLNVTSDDSNLIEWVSNTCSPVHCYLTYSLCLHSVLWKSCSKSFMHPVWWFVQTKLKREHNVESVESIVDQKLEGKYPRETYSKLVDLALMCASFEKNKRPSMKVTISEFLL